jgi:hypothetical protein
MRKSVIRIFIGVVVAAALWLYLFCGPISHVVDTPLMREYSRIHEIGGKLRWYSDAHSAFPNGAATNSSVSELVAIGVLSADDGAYIHDHQIEYRGFDLSHIAADVPVFEAIFTNTSSPRRIIGFSDGSTTMQNLNQTP